FSGNSNLYKFYDNLNSNIVDVNVKCNSCEDGKEDPEYMKLCCSLEKIIEQWKSKCTVKENEKCTCCDYLLYWLYSKIIESNLHFRSIIWTYDKFEPLLKSSVFKVDSESEKKKIYDINVLKKKRVLFDFLLHYDIIKDKLNHINKGNEEKFCNYIYYIFELYKEIENKASEALYKKEVNEFKEKFNSGNNNELNFINEKCPGKCLDSVFKAKSKTFCHLKERKEADSYMPRIPYIAKAYNTNEKINELKLRKKDVFEELPSNKIYDELNKDIESGKTDSSSRCDNLSLQNDKSKSLCKKVERNLKKLSGIYQLKNESHNDRCLYFNYWVHDELRKMFNGKTEDSYPNSKDINKLRDEWYHISDGLMKGDVNENYEKIKSKYSTNNNPTAPEAGKPSDASRNVPPKPENFYSVKDFSKHKACFYNSDCTFYDCDDMKALYDYFKNHDTIEKKISTKNVEQCKIYHDYVSYIEQIYDKYKDDCCNYGFCDYFNCNDKYDPNELLYKLKNCSE
ncbi:hypothetical protein PVBG_03672, partial [Plasmodium vivax Brazil I]